MAVNVQLWGMTLLHTQGELRSTGKTIAVRQLAFKGQLEGEQSLS